MAHPRISLDPSVMGGEAYIAGTRAPVDAIIGHPASGDAIDEVLKDDPTPTREDVFAALAYAADILRNEGVMTAWLRGYSTPASINSMSRQASLRERRGASS